jgi:hypothetical protein
LKKGGLCANSLKATFVFSKNAFMKFCTLVLSLLFLLSCPLIKAQPQKGKTIVGAAIGSAFFNKNNTELSNTLGSSSTTKDSYEITLNPMVGWFINDKVAAGFSPLFGYAKEKRLGKASNNNTFLKDETSNFNFGVGGFARMYFNGKSDIYRFFGQYNLLAGINSNKSDGFEYERLGIYVDRYNYKSSGNFFVNTGINLGVSKFLSSNTALDFFIGYKYSYTKSNPKGTTTRDYTNPATPDENSTVNYDQNISENGFSLGVGFQVFLDKKKK